jgi:DNA polymerase
MTREEVFIGNVLKCRPPDNRTPNAGEISACRGFLDEQIRLIRPEVICAMGAPAARTLLDQPRAGIGALRGRFHDLGGIPVMPTFHPAYLLRSPSEKGKCWEDMKMIRDLLKKS